MSDFDQAVQAEAEASRAIDRAGDLAHEVAESRVPWTPDTVAYFTAVNEMYDVVNAEVEQYLHQAVQHG